MRSDGARGRGANDGRPRRKGRSAQRAKRGSSAQHRAHWRATYEATPYDELPWYQAEPSPAVVDAAREGFLPARGAVLDIGCGAGSNVIWLARSGYEAHGVDLSPGAVRAARERADAAGLTVDVQEADALALPFPDGRFDAALDHGCFHTLPFARRAEYAREVARVIRSGGCFLLAWVAREYTSPLGPPHRPSLNEVTQVFERRFQFLRAEFRAGSEASGLPSYTGWLARRSTPQPPMR